MIMLRCALEDGARLPKGYGIAWFDHARQVTICLPIPLNVIAGALRIGLQWLRSPWPSMTPSERACYERGRNAAEQAAGFLSARREKS